MRADSRSVRGRAWINLYRARVLLLFFFIYRDTMKFNSVVFVCLWARVMGQYQNGIVFNSGVPQQQQSTDVARNFVSKCRRKGFFFVEISIGYVTNERAIWSVLTIFQDFLYIISIVTIWRKITLFAESNCLRWSFVIKSCEVHGLLYLIFFYLIRSFRLVALVVLIV